MKWFKGLDKDWRMFIYGLVFGIVYSFGKILVGFEPSTFGINLLVLFFCCMIVLPFINMFDNKYIVNKENDII